MRGNRVQCSRLATWAVAIGVGLAGCASVPPLDPGQAAIVNRSQTIAGQLGTDTKVSGSTDVAGGRAAFAAYYSEMGLQAVGVKAPGAQGSSTKTTYFISNGRVFYARANTTGGAAKPEELQLFYDAAGTVLSSRKQIDGKLAAVSSPETRALMDLYSAVLAAADQARGPGYKIRFHLSKISDLGLAGPPLHAVRYQFCFPAEGAYAEQIQGIDATATFLRDPTPACGAGQWQATGSTHQPGFRQVLLDLAGLPYVESIQARDRS